MRKNITVLGIDPGLSFTGFAVAEVARGSHAVSSIREIGVLQSFKGSTEKAGPSSDYVRRANLQARAIGKLLDIYRVDMIAVEVVALTPNLYPTLSFGIMIGIICSLNIPIVQVTPYDVKRAVSGSRSASKRDVIDWALRKTASLALSWPTSSKPNKMKLSLHGRHVSLKAEHPADALATIEAATVSDGFRIAAASIA